MCCFGKCVIRLACTSAWSVLIRLSPIDCTHIRCVVVYAVKKTRLEVCTMGNAARTCWISPHWARIPGNTRCINSCTCSNTRRICVKCRFNSHNNTAIFTVYLTWPNQLRYRVPRKETSLGESLAESYAYNHIQDSGETFDEREKSRQESRQKSHPGSRLDSW